VSAAGVVTVAAGWLAVLAPGGSLSVRPAQQIRVAPIPDPSLVMLLAGGLAGLGGARRRAPDPSRMRSLEDARR
jgi:hypothetical protein